MVLEGYSSGRRSLDSGVSRRPVLGPLLFLIYVNDLTNSLSSLPFIYADDTTFFEIVEDRYFLSDV